jgi:lactam utilization protein B
MPDVDAKVIDATHLELSEAISLEPGESVRVSIHDLGKADRELQAKLTRDKPSARDRERAWCMANQDLLRSYAGQWVVLEGEEIITHGTNPRQLIETARAKEVGTPFVFHVEEPRPDVIHLGL